MWCEHCRQNVTGMVSQTLQCVCCSRCGCALPSIASSITKAAGDPVRSPEALPALDDWNFEEDLRHIERVLRIDRADVPVLNRDGTFEAVRRGEPSLPSPSWLHRLRAGMAAMLICAGLAATACGLILLAWWFWGQRPELLTPGLICAAAGQFVLLGGFLVQPPVGQSADAQSAATKESQPGEQWLDVHRRIDEMLRADLPQRRELKTGERGALPGEHGA